MSALQRIQVPMPDTVAFETELTVCIGDINYGNHLANDAVLRLAHEARIRFLAAHGCTELDVFGAGLIMADAAVQYCAQAFHGDVLQVQVAVGHIGSAGFALYTRFCRRSDGVEIARVKNGLVFFDYADQRVTKTPPAFRERFGAAAAE